MQKGELGPKKGPGYARKKTVLRQAAIGEILEQARKDYEAVRLKRIVEAVESKQHIAELCHPAQLRPDLEWVPLEIPSSTFYKVSTCATGMACTHVHACIQGVIADHDSSHEHACASSPCSR